MQNRRKKTTTTETDHYKVLDLPSGMQGTKLTLKQITKAYKRKALQLHPDKRPNDPNANADFQKLQFSYATLMDPHARIVFDRSLLTRSDDKPSSSSSWSSSSSKPKKKTRKKNRYDDMPFTFTNIVRETHRCVIGMGLVWSALKIHAVVGGVAGGCGVCFCYSIALLLLAYEFQLQRLNEREYDDDEDIDDWVFV